MVLTLSGRSMFISDVQREKHSLGISVIPDGRLMSVTLLNPEKYPCGIEVTPDCTSMYLMYLVTNSRFCGHPMLMRESIVHKEKQSDARDLTLIGILMLASLLQLENAFDWISVKLVGKLTELRDVQYEKQFGGI